MTLFTSVIYPHLSGEVYIPDPGKEDVEDNGSPANTAQETKSQDGDGECHDPVDVLCKEDLIRDGVSAVTLRGDDRVCETRGYGIVGDCAYKKTNGEEVVEDLFAMLRLEAQSKEDELIRVSDVVVCCCMMDVRRRAGRRL